MMNKKEITKIAKRILHPHKGYKEPKIIHPTRDWIIGLLIALSIVGGSAVWSASTYLEYQSLSVGDTNEIEEGVVVYRESLVKAALEQFSSREEKWDSLLESQQTPVEDSTTDTETEEGQDTTSSTEEVDVADTELSTTTETQVSVEDEVLEEVEEAASDVASTTAN